MQIQTRNIIIFTSILGMGILIPVINWYRSTHQPSHCEQHQFLVESNGYETDLGKVGARSLEIDSFSENQSLIVKEICGIKNN